jgi:glucose/arabinose dehydrogenase
VRTPARALTLALFCLGAIAAAPASAGAGELPSGFQDTIAIKDLNGPTAVRFAPDGEVFVAQKNGKILRFDDVDDDTPTVFADLRKQVYDNGDRGLLGLAVDPQFPVRPYVYALYTFDHVLGEGAAGSYPRWGKGPNYEGDPCPMPGSPGVDACPVSGRLTRFTDQGGVAGAEKVLIEDWCQQDSTHSIGGLQFGPEGALFASGGEGASYLEPDYGQYGWPHKNQCGDPPGGGALTPPSAEGGSLRSQDLRTPFKPLAPSDPTGLAGTLIRVDPDTGAGLPGNPLYSSLDANERRIVAYGFRNPFRFAIDPDREEVLVNNVGNGTDEEIDRIGLTPSTPYNSGWPCYEGDHRNPDFDNLHLDLCEGLYAHPGAASTPFFSYDHGDPVAPDDPCPSGFGSAITGSVIYPGGTFPAEYDGALFFADAVRGCIYTMLSGGVGEGPDPDAVHPFLTDGGQYTGADIEVGPDGNLYYLSLFGDEAVHRISYDPIVPIAKLTADKEWGGLPLTVNFDAGGSSGAGLRYAWDLDGNGSFETNGTFAGTGSATQTRVYSTAVNKTISVRVKNTGGSISTAAITIYPGDSPPKVSIDSPAESLTWRVGQQIAFSGSAKSDSGNGAAIAPSGPPSSPEGLSWRTKILHCPDNEEDCHAHSLPDFNNTASGVLTAVDHNLPSRLRFELTATDARGLSATKEVEIYPRTVTLTAASSPPGATLGLGVRSGAGPLSLPLIEGASVTLSAPEMAEIGGVTYDFVSWSDGGPRVHSVLANSSVDYTANYAESSGEPEPQPEPELEPPSSGKSGSPSQPGGPALTPLGPAAPPARPILTLHPPKRASSTTARFEFASPEMGVGFACKLDERPLEPCGLPWAYKRLKPGKHVFRVYAEAQGESVEYSPATAYRWQVLEKKR